MASEITIVGSRDWGVREMDGVDRISGTELGRSLDYCTSQPAKFNEKVVGRLLKEGKLNDSDVRTERSSRQVGAASRTVNEYWLTLPAARRVALEHVRTKAAAQLRRQVGEQLERLIEQRKTALQPSELGVIAIIQAGFERISEQQRAISLALREPNKPASVYIDDERVHLLKSLARDLAAARGDASLQPVWQAVRTKFGFGKHRLGENPRVFDTVTVDRFDETLNHLRAELEKARNAPKKTVTSLSKRPRAPTGKVLDIQGASSRLNNVGHDVPACALADLGTAKGLYSVVGVMTYEAPETGKNKPAVLIDESSMPELIEWCNNHPRELEALVSNRRMLDAALSAKQKLGK